MPTTQGYINELEKEMKWLSTIIEFRKLQIERDCRTEPHLQPPKLDLAESFYAQFIHEFQLSFEDRLMLILTMAPHINPNYLTFMLSRDNFYKQPFLVMENGDAILGKVRGERFTGILPTGLMYLYLIAGTNTRTRLELTEKIFANMLFVLKGGIVRPLAVEETEPILTNILTIAKPHLFLFITNQNLLNL